MSAQIVTHPALKPLPPRIAQDWVMPVIADLARFATLNRLPALAADLERCLETALTELAPRFEEPPS